MDDNIPRNAEFAHLSREPLRGGHLVLLSGVELDIAGEKGERVVHGSLLAPGPLARGLLREYRIEQRECKQVQPCQDKECNLEADRVRK